METILTNSTTWGAEATKLNNNFNTLVNDSGWANYADTVITGRNGDGILIGLDFKAKPTSAGTSYLEVWLDITGGTGTPTNLANLYKRIVIFPKGSGVERPVNFTVAGYTLNTWEANGTQVKVRANGTRELYDIRYVITRTHKALT